MYTQNADTNSLSADRFAEIYLENMEPKPELSTIEGVWFCKGQDPTTLGLTLVGCGATKLEALDAFVRSLPSFRKD